MTLKPLELTNGTAVVTGGANGIGKGIVKALLEKEMIVIIADIEQSVLDSTVEELSDFGEVHGCITDVSDPDSVEALADYVFSTFDKCTLLFNNAGVGSGGGGKAWEHEPNDWKWCFGVNVFGMSNGVMSFIPRMLKSGQPGHVINTSSGDGGFAPVPMASVYASSKAAVSCFTEALHHQLLLEGRDIGASIFYPSGGLMNTGLFNSQRNRPSELERVKNPSKRKPMSFEELKNMLEKSGREVKVADLDALGRFVVECVVRRQYIIAKDLDETIELLHRRADAIGRFEVPPHHEMGV
ncbi:MAG: SDR family NAD(P)-dependent oxidoreductase [Acidimicrobiales bacterium]|nr:SDR family NAD(P)-dependent oxidoreductase [Acidimicrobiales bacterium]|tara:strand:- start:731 stop:1621 length:891 start_codon:yes stop_codon:yes gene_type:complete